MKPTFKEQYDKIVSAYFKDELNPYMQCACFIGNLLNNRSGWFKIIEEELNGFYSFDEIRNLEHNFLKIIKDNTVKEKYSSIYIEGSSYDYPVNDCRQDVFKHSNYENALFMAMDSTLQMLKQLHIDKGEEIDEYNFQKRELQLV